MAKWLALSFWGGHRISALRFSRELGETILTFTSTLPFCLSFPDLFDNSTIQNYCPDLHAFFSKAIRIPQSRFIVIVSKYVILINPDS